jgi:hypothetical protein
MEKKYLLNYYIRVIYIVFQSIIDSCLPLLKLEIAYTT